MTFSTNAYLSKYKAPASLADIEQPSKTIVFAEGIDLIRPPYAVQTLGSPDVVGCWHMGGKCVIGSGIIDPTSDASGLNNILWGDGHVKPRPRADLVPPSKGGKSCSDNLWDRVYPSPNTFTAAGCGSVT